MSTKDCVLPAGSPCTVMVAHQPPEYMINVQQKHGHPASACTSNPTLGGFHFESTDDPYSVEMVRDNNGEPCSRCRLLCNTEKPAGGGGVQRGPSLVVAAVHVGAVLHQELHHVQVVVDARLQESNVTWG